MSSDHPASHLQIAVLGVGAIGSAFAFQLAQVGRHQVTAIARPGSPRLAQLARDHAIVKSTGDRVEVHVAECLDEGIPYDLILVTLLAHQVGAVLPALRRSAARQILFLFNNFEPELLRDAFGADRCAFGMPFIQASLDRDGRVLAKISAAGPKSRLSSSEWVAVFNRAGLPAVLEPRMLLWLRCHAPLGAALESVSAAGMKRGGGASWAESTAIARGLQETFTLVQRLGHPLYPAGKALLHASPMPLVAGILWLLSRIRSFRELLASGAGESRALVDTFVAAAPAAQPPVSVPAILAMRPGL